VICLKDENEKSIPVKTTFTSPSTQDYERFAACGLDAAACLDGRTKVIFENSDGNIAMLFIDQQTYDRLGEEYIAEHTTLRYSESLEEWTATLSQNDYYNDTERYPELLIEVEFVGVLNEDGSEIYRNRNSRKRFYLRQVAAREPFARWLGCNGRPKLDDGSELRANLIFSNNGQTEKIRYYDWNGVAAYGDTFNSKFNEVRI